jgi:hypothetical protein
MNSYELSRKWFDWCFENPEKISPNHSALYFFAIEHCNRLGWRKKFGFPTEMAKDAIGIKSYNTYIKTLNDLVDWGFIQMIERSKNQYSSNIIALSNFNKALDKALDKAIVKASEKQRESTSQSICSIDKPITNNQLTIEPLKEELENFSNSKNEFFGKEVLDSPSWIETIAMQNKITPEEVPAWIDSFNKKLLSELDNKFSKKEYASHFSRWLSVELTKTKQNGKQPAQFGATAKTAYKFDAARIIETNTRET